MARPTLKQYLSRLSRLNKNRQILSRAAERNRALSTVFGTILFMILIVSVAASIFLALYRYNDNVNQAIKIEDARSQEKVVMTALTLINETAGEITTVNITGIKIDNIGSAIIQIKAVYVDEEFICDPSASDLNSDGAYIGSQTSKLINIKHIPFNPSSFLTIATSKGMKAIELESSFLNLTSSGFTPVMTNYGPLRLNFTLFYYRETDVYGYPTGTWQPGSNLSASVRYCTWNITVTNIDTRDITLNQYSCLTLVPNAGGGQLPWYTDNPDQLIHQIRPFK